MRCVICRMHRCGEPLAGSPTHPLFINRLYVPTSYSDADALTKDFSPLCGSTEPATCLNGVPAAPGSWSHQVHIFAQSHDLFLIIVWSTTVTTFIFECCRLISICGMIPKSAVPICLCFSSLLQVWFAQTAFAKYHGGIDGQFLLPPMESGQIPLIKAQGLAEAISA